MNAVIIYRERDLAKEANALFERARERAAPSAEWNLDLWRVDMLERSALAREAQRNVEESHIVMLAFRSQSEISPALLDWLEEGARHRWVPDAALAVFQGSPGDTLSGTVSRPLRDFAERNGLCLISGEVAPSESDLPELFGTSILPFEEGLSDVPAAGHCAAEMSLQTTGGTNA